MTALPVPAELKTLFTHGPVWSVSAAESLTCGHVQTMLGSVSGSSQYFAGGLTAYSLDQKAKLLGVDANRAVLVNSVSREVVEQMALGTCRLFDTTFGVATTGYAEPAPEHGVSFPFAWWAVCDASGADPRLVSGCIEYPGLGRQEAQRLVADLVLRELLKTVREARARTR